ncbi:MAG: glycosyltransferase, partial [Cyanobacteria bacterium]|nr:glycosyltransferase [Cyanobacteriota bacterium]
MEEENNISNSKVVSKERDQSSVPLLAILGLIIVGYFFYDPHTANQTFQLSLSAILCLLGLSIFHRRDSELIRRILMLAATFSAIRFIVWRAYTLNLTSPLNSVVSILLFSAEIYAVIVLFLICIQNWFLTSQRELGKHDRSYTPSVDVYVCTYNEPIEIVRRTVYGAKFIDYPNFNVYILDDGRRDYMMNLALEIGVGYLTRPDNRNAKAGNINNAMKQTSGEFILILDADAIPCRTILQECMPYCADEKVAIVQTPHRFMNAAPIQRNLYLEGVLPHEQELFFQVSMIGKDYWNSAIFAGSAGVIRRSVLDEFGGMPSQTVIEDCELSMQVHQKGYKSVYVPIQQSIALCPETLDAYLIQQSRWAKGQTQMLMLMNPFLVSGLTFAQRVCYLSGNLYYLFGLPRLAFVIVPALFLIFGFCATSVSWLKYSVIAVPFLLLYLLAQNYTFKNFRHTFWSDVYELSLAPYVAHWTVNTIIEPSAPRFDVTPKGTRRGLLQFDAHLVWVHILLLLLCVFAFGIGVVKIILQFDVSGNSANLVWSAYN